MMMMMMVNGDDGYSFIVDDDDGDDIRATRTCFPIMLVEHVLLSIRMLPRSRAAVRLW